MVFCCQRTLKWPPLRQKSTSILRKQKKKIFFKCCKILDLQLETKRHSLKSLKYQGNGDFFFFFFLISQSTFNLTAFNYRWLFYLGFLSQGIFFFATTQITLQILPNSFSTMQLLVKVRWVPFLPSRKSQVRHQGDCWVRCYSFSGLQAVTEAPWEWEKEPIRKGSLLGVLENLTTEPPENHI